MSLSGLGTIVGALAGECGHVCIKEDKLFLDRLSARLLSFPATLYMHCL